MRTYESHSMIFPPEWDTKSSPGRVYHNFDVVETTEDSENTSYRYTVEEYTREEYANLWRVGSTQRMNESDMALVELAGMLSDIMGGVAELASMIAGGE